MFVCLSLSDKWVKVCVCVCVRVRITGILLFSHYHAHKGKLANITLQEHSAVSIIVPPSQQILTFALENTLIVHRSPSNKMLLKAQFVHSSVNSTYMDWIFLYKNFFVCAYVYKKGLSLVWSVIKEHDKCTVHLKEKMKITCKTCIVSRSHMKGEHVNALIYMFHEPTFRR